MSSLVLNGTFDCRDAGGVARFWEAVTGYPKELVQHPGNHHWVVSAPDGSLPRLVFVTVPEEKSIKNRMHLDLIPNSSQEDEVARLLDLGASVIDDRRRSDPGGWVVIADPEGNEFCVEQPGRSGDRGPSSPRSSRVHTE